MIAPRRVLFDTTVLRGAFHSPNGPNAKLLDLAAQRAPVLDGFLKQELAPFLEAYEPLFEPEAMSPAPLSRSLGRYAGLVGRPLGEVLHIITGKDREALLASRTTSFPMNFESIDIADLHVITGAIDNHADELCSNDARTLSYDPIGSLRVRRSIDIAADLGLIDLSASAARITS